MLAMSWNTDLAQEYAAGLGREARDLGVDGWYAPSMNIHRSAFAGRNFEYFSEDGVLSAKMAAAECQGVYEYSLYPFIKHFALNDQETNRNGMLCTWTTEQAMREIYLKPFEQCIKEAGDNPITVMASYNYIGTVWATANPDLLNTVLRDEWGFQGMVLSDYFGNYGSEFLTRPCAPPAQQTKQEPPHMRGRLLFLSGAAIWAPPYSLV